MFFKLRQTRSGSIFSPYDISPFQDMPVLAISTPADVDVAQLVKIAVEEEYDQQDDLPLRDGADSSAKWLHLEDLIPKVEGPPDIHSPDPLVTFAPSLSSPSGAVETSGMEATTRDHAQSRKNRQRKRKREASEPSYGMRKQVFKKYIEPGKATAVATDLDFDQLPVTSCGYSGVNMKKGEGQGTGAPPALAALLEQGYELVENDGFTCMPFVSRDGTIYAVAAGQPRDPTWQDDCAKVAEALIAAGHTAKFEEHQLHHKRGDFPVIDCGITHSRGTTEPKNLKLNQKTQETVDRLCSMKEMRRLALYATAAFATWAPNLYNYYKEHLDKLLQRMPHLKPPFGPKSIFVCASKNSAEKVCSARHRDQLNLAFGWCAIHALGNFNHKLGGHLVLDDIKKVVEFPSGSLMLIPSAILVHRNTPVGDKETRMSFTQYSGGGVFRYVDNGFRTQRELQDEDPEQYEKMLEDKKTRWSHGVSLWSKLSDLVEPDTK